MNEIVEAFELYFVLRQHGINSLGSDGEPSDPIEFNPSYDDNPQHCCQYTITDA